MRALTLGSMVLFISSAACIGAQDDPSTVHDLRVLGMSFEPPELLISECNARTLQTVIGIGRDAGSKADAGIPGALVAQLIQLTSKPLQFKVLIGDPDGGGRSLDYRISVCTDASDRRCETSRRVDLATGTTTGGELTLQVAPVNDFAASLKTGSTPLLFEIAQADTYRGLGGIRVPVVLELSASDTGERIFAQKLMPYSCKFVPGMVQNVTPVLPGMTARDAGWGEEEVIELRGREKINMLPLDFSSLEEQYVSPSLALQPVAFKESWKIAHYATAGTMSPYETGGTNIGGDESRSAFSWTPDSVSLAAQNVQFYFVVRDGRGGESWLTRRARWSP